MIHEVIEMSHKGKMNPETNNNGINDVRPYLPQDKYIKGVNSLV